MIGLGLVVAGTPLRAVEPIIVDRTPALQIGRFEVSHYCVDKYFGRYVEAERQRRRRPPDSAERKAWMEAFLIRQAMVPRAAALGYDRRPEVVDVVSRMERYMLTQPQGPFYRSLYDSAPIPAERLARLYRQSGTTVEARLVRFEDVEAAHAGLGGDIDRCPTDEKRCRLERGRAQDGVTWHDGSLAWPYGPFAAMADALAEGDETWIETHADHGAVYYADVRARVRHPVDVAEIPAGFEAFVRELDQQTLRQSRAARQLADAGLRTDAAAIAKLAAALSRLPAEAPQIPEALIAGPVAGTLGWYRPEPGGGVVAIEAGSFVRWFNRLFVRQVPRTRADLRAMVAAMALEELDFRAARAAGIDRQPQFVEDRKGFQVLQLLEWFEREQLVPSIAVTQEEMETYRREHAAEFIRTDAIRGHYLTAAGPGGLATWTAGGEAIAAGTRGGADGVAAEEIDVTAARPAPGLERDLDAMLQMPAGSRFGPVRCGAGFAMFIKEKDLSRSPIPAAAAAVLIRPVLLRRRLDARERKLATEDARVTAIRDDIVPARYGIEVPLDLPWRAGHAPEPTRRE